MPSETLKKALKDGLITQKQYDKLPEKLLEGIVKSKRGKSKPAKKPKGKKGKKKEPIFKVVEEGNTAVSLSESRFSRGDRIAIARYLKQVRLCEIEKPEEDLNTLSLRQLREKCKQQGLRGYWSKGIKKGDLVNMLNACKKPC